MLKRASVYIIAAVMLILSACSEPQETAHTPRHDTETQKTSAPIESSIFGRKTEYNSFTPAENISLPINSDEITDMLQIEKTLYFLTDGAIYYLKLETGESSKLFDTDAGMFSTYENELFTYSSESGKICVYSSDGTLISEQMLTVESDDVTANELIVTDSYYSFICSVSSNGITVTQNIVFDRNTLEKVTTVSESVKTSIVFRVFSSYKGDSILKAEESSMDSRLANVYEINLETGKSTKLIEANINCMDFIYDISYNEKTDTVIFFAAPKEMYHSYDDAIAGIAAEPTRFTMTVSEYSLSDPDNILLNRYYHENPTSSKVFVCAYENIISMICTADSEYRYFDYLSPPESITLALNFAELYEDVIYNFEKDTGILVRTVSYGLSDRLDIKLMAGDTDFDLFVPVYKNETKYFISGMFEDLKKYEGLKSRLDGNTAVGYVSELNGKYVGIPTYISNFTSRENMTDMYSQFVSMYLYIAQNVDIVNGSYNDPDGEKLYKLLKFLNDNPDGNEDKMPFGRELCLLDCGFIVMNPTSTHKENAAKFLEYAFDIFSEDDKYIPLDSTDSVYVTWKCFSSDYTTPILDVCTKVRTAQTDGKTSTLKELARKASSEVSMRLEE